MPIKLIYAYHRSKNKRCTSIPRFVSHEMYLCVVCVYLYLFVCLCGGPVRSCMHFACLCVLISVCVFVCGAFVHAFCNLMHAFMPILCVLSHVSVCLCVSLCVSVCVCLAVVCVCISLSLSLSLSPNTDLSLSPRPSPHPPLPPPPHPSLRGR